MLTHSQAKEIVNSSLKSTGVVASGNQTLRDAGLNENGLEKLVVTLVADRSVGVPRFQHVLDPNVIGDLNLNMTADDLTDQVAKLSAGKLCSNPTNPHEQQCCPYPITCPICGAPVL
jgi:hypothetical protein